LKEDGVVKAYGGAQQVRAVVPGIYSGRTCCAAATTAYWMKNNQLQQPQMITTFTIETVQMLCF
jgi:hypothetical protein